MIRATALRCALAGATLFLALASPSFAQGGIDLAWNDCGNNGLASRSFSCASNSGEDVLVGSAITGIDMPQLNAAYAVLDLSSDPFLSSWWQLDTGGCREGALTPGFDFSTGYSSCLDPWAGAANGGTIYGPQQGPLLSRIRIFCTTPTPTAVLGTEEYYFFRLTLSHVKATGNGSCGGCATKACLVLELIELSDPSLGPDHLTLNTPIFRQYVTWQGGQSNCPGVDQTPVPVRASTWGLVKSLYR